MMKMKNTFLMRVLLCLCLICIYFAAILTPLSSFADDSIAQRKAKLTREVQTKKKMVALTFDDGPHPILTPKILDLLKKYHAKATFSERTQILEDRAYQQMSIMNISCFDRTAM